MNGAYKAGDVVYLRPRTKGCAQICWKQPRAEVINDTRPWPTYVDVLVDGETEPRQIDARNIGKTPPKQAESKPHVNAAFRQNKPLDMPDGMEEVTLW